MLYATYLGGPVPPGATFADSGMSQISAIAFDGQGNIVLAGSTGADFPVTPGAYQSKLNADCTTASSFVGGPFCTSLIFQAGAVFVTRLDPSGTSILSSTLLGGACYDQVDSIDVDADGNVWLAGSTDSNPFPQVAPFATGPPIGGYLGKFSGYVANFDASGDRLLLSSYIDAPGSAVVASDRFGGAWVGAENAIDVGLLAHIGSAPASPLVITGAGNSYTGRDGPLSPGELATITLAGFDPDQPTNLGYTAPLPTSLAGAQVLFDGKPAALAAVVPGSIYCVTPYDLAGKTSTTIQVKFNGQVSTAIVADVAPIDPGLLSLDGSGTGQAYARNADGTLIRPKIRSKLARG